MKTSLRSIGFSQMNRVAAETLMDWVSKEPDHLSIVRVGEEETVAVAIRSLPGQVGVCAIGEVQEDESIHYYYLFPYVAASIISTEVEVSYEKQADEPCFLGMCEDDRVGMSLIFRLKNVAELLAEREDKETPYKRTTFTMLLTDAAVLLPVEKIDSPESVPSDEVYSFVESFFMPYGMESTKYYFLGEIQSCNLFKNPYTEEEYYRLSIVMNAMPIDIVVNREDVLGEPERGYRIKGHGILMGELR